MGSVYKFRARFRFESIRFQEKSPMKMCALPVVILLALAVPLCAAETDGFKDLFNGKDLTGWDGDSKLWSVQDGAIVGETTKENPAKGNTFLVWKGGELKDFEFRCLFKLEGSNNSGVQYRSKEVSKFVLAGYQCDLQYTFPNMCKLYDEKKRGRICMAGEVVTMEEKARKNITGTTPDLEKLKTADKKGEWNECVVIAQGNRLIHKINGIVSIDFTDNDEAGRALSGVLGLQIHGGAPMKISFKEIKLKELPAK